MCENFTDLQADLNMGLSTCISTSLCLNHLAGKHFTFCHDVNLYSSRPPESVFDQK